MVKEIKDMTNKELREEYEGIEQHIKLCAYGKWELNFREDLIKEATKRKIDL